MSFWKRILKSTPKTHEDVRATEILPVSDDITLIATLYDSMPSATFTPLLNLGWELTGSFTMWEVANFVREHKKDWPHHTLFAVLEDVGQAFYTSGHSLMSHDLDDIDPDKQTGLHPSSFQSFSADEPKEFCGLCHPSEFPIRHEMFMDFVAEKNSTGWFNRLSWNESGYSCPSLIGANTVRPKLEDWRWPRDKKSFVMQVPVARSCDAISAFVNGYFASDLQPHENYFLARALEEKFGLQIFGLGASYAGYMRDKALSEKEANAFGVFLARLYSDEPSRDLINKIANIAMGQHTLFLAYVDQ